MAAIWVVVFVVICGSFVFDQVAQADDTDFIRCPLEWKSVSAGEVIVSNTIPTTTFGERHFVARGRSSNGVLTVGRYENAGSCSIGVQSTGNVEQPAVCEVLTNPHGCVLEWRRGVDTGMHAIPADDSRSGFVGRGVAGGVMLSGHIEGGNVAIASESLSLVMTGQLETLCAYSRGLTLTMTDFVFSEDVFDAGKDFLGLDEVHNRADAVILHEVKQSKRVFESTLFTTKSSWGHTFNIGLNVGYKADAKIGNSSVKIPMGFNLGYQLDYKTDKQKRLYHESETEIQIERRVTIPAHTSVEICSTAVIKNNLELEYRAKGYYSAPGLSHEQVSAILAKDGKLGVPDGNGVVVVEEGSFGGNLALMTQFLVFPYETDGCSLLASRIADLQRDVRIGRLALRGEEYGRRNAEIDELLTLGNSASPSEV